MYKRYNISKLSNIFPCIKKKGKNTKSGFVFRDVLSILLLILWCYPINTVSLGKNNFHCEVSTSRIDVP